MTESVKRGAELVVVAGATAAINFAFLMYAGRKLGPREYADFWAAMSLLFFWTLFLNPLAPFASHVAARRTGDEIGALRRSLRRLTVMPAIPFVAIAAIASPYLATFLHLRSPLVIVITAAAVAAYAVLSAERGLFQGAGRFREYNVNALIEAVVRITAAIALLAFTPTAVAAVGSYVAGFVVALALILLLRTPAGTGTADVWPDLRGAGIPIFLLMTSIAVFQNADSLAVKRWFSVHDAAIYGSAAALARTFSALATPLWVLLVPSVASSQTPRRAIAVGVRICGAYLALAAVGIAILAALRGPIFTKLYGPALSGGAALLIPLCGLVVLMNVTLLLAQTLVGMQRPAILYVVVTAAIGEIAALVIYHPSIVSLIAMLYGLHLALAAILALVIATAMLPSRS